MALMNFTGDVFYSLDKCLKPLKAEPNLQRGITSIMSSFYPRKDLSLFIYPFCIHPLSTPLLFQSMLV